MNADKPIIVGPPPTEIDVRADVWARLEAVSATIAESDTSPSAAQVGSLLLTWALDQLGPDAIKKLADKKAHEQAGE